MVHAVNFLLCLHLSSLWDFLPSHLSSLKHLTYELVFHCLPTEHKTKTDLFKVSLHREPGGHQRPLACSFPTPSLTPITALHFCASPSHKQDDHSSHSPLCFQMVFVLLTMAFRKQSSLPFLPNSGRVLEDGQLHGTGA